jgi:SNF2 family DNA or RNA helicase
MILNYYEKTGKYTLSIPRDENANTLIQSLMSEHGLNFSTSASTPQTACLFTDNAYAAATFAEYATEAAKAELYPITKAIEKSWLADSSRVIRCPADKELWGFQRASVSYALDRPHTLIGDQPGLGKTPIAICFANEVRAERVLVICPASIRIQWVKKIHEWSTMRRPISAYAILKGSHGVNPQATWTVVSYELARSPAVQRALIKCKFDVLVLDEAHYAKTVDSQRTRAIFGGGLDAEQLEPIASRCERIIALTGTPLPNRPREAYTLSRHLCFDAIDWLSEAGFSERFNPSMKVETVDKTNGKTKFYIDERTGRHAELQNRLRANFMVRHLKKDVLTQLPEVIHDIIQMEETGPVKQALKAESLLDIDPENLAGVDATIMGHIAAVRHQMGVALAPQAAAYVETLLEGGEDKILLFAYHVAVLDIFVKALGKYGFIRIDGSTSPQRRYDQIQDFINKPEIRVAIVNYLSGGVGTDGLQEACSHAVFAESSWVPGDNQQGIDRLHRIGQGSGVLIDFLVAPGSISERILGNSLRKANVIHKALDKRLKLS